MSTVKYLFYLLLVMMVLPGIRQCRSVPDDIILTVTGPIPSSEIGTSLTHEHLLVDFLGADSTGTHRWDRQEVERVVLPYLLEIQELNVQTFFECTPAYLGRDPELLKRLSELTGMNLVTNTGFYGARNNQFLPRSFYSMSAEALAALWIAEYAHGIDGTGIRPGFIKIGVDDNETLSPEHHKIVHAAALTHLNTGLAIASHTGPDRPVFQQMAILKSIGVDLSSFIWVHAQNGTLEGNIKAARSGAWISLDNVDAQRQPATAYDVEWYAERIISLKEAGVLNRVLISHDAGWYSPGEENGGSFRGFTDISEKLLPALKERGFSRRELDQLMIRNPGAAFSLRTVYLQDL